MYSEMKTHLEKELAQIEDAGLTKKERIILGPQNAGIKVGSGEVINFCANNYLGLGDHPEIVQAAKKSLDDWGYGVASVRFICGTQEIHKSLEKEVASFLQMEDCILYPSCFDANGGIFETLLSPEDAVISDQLNHASIIDGIRLSKAQRFRYEHANMKHLEEILQETQKNRFRLIVSDGVFSMDGNLAKLPEICDLADKYDALVMIDECHATGFIGKTGRGTPEHFGVTGRVDIISTTFGKALGGASGGCIAAHKEIIDLLRQRSRPYLFSNSIPPTVVSATRAAMQMLSENTKLRDKLEDNTRYFRSRIKELGFQIKGDEHPIVPIMLGDAKLANQFADQLLTHGIYVIGFSYPVVPKGEARIRVQLSAAHEKEHLDKALSSFEIVGKELSVI